MQYLNSHKYSNHFLHFICKFFGFHLQSYKELEKQKSIDEENAKKERDKKYNVGLAEVEKLFTQQSKPIRDSYGIRWIQCEKCKEIKPSNQFVYYGGNNHANLGLCNKCSSEHKKF